MIFNPSQPEYVPFDELEFDLEDDSESLEGEEDEEFSEFTEFDDLDDLDTDWEDIS